MKIELIENVHEIKSEIFDDKRGSFLSCFKENEELFKKVWLDKKICQINLSLTRKKGTIRGLHYQEKPYQESKLIRCLRGKVWDVIIDLRKNSNTYKKWFSLELCSSKNNAIFVPEGCAHGFQSLQDNCELLYIHSNNYRPSHESGIKWDDPTINVSWPLDLAEISDRDNSLPYLEEI